MSYLSRHRPVCTVIQEIYELAEKRGDSTTMLLCLEAKNYAERMSARLMFYKTSIEIEKLGVHEKESK